MSDFSRAKVCDNFCEHYKELSGNEKEDFSGVCNRLLGENYIYGQKKEDRNAYFIILKLKETIENYFDIIDYSLNWDSSYKIFYLKSKLDRNRLKLKKIESVLVLLFRKFYYVKSKEDVNASINIMVSYEELLNEIDQTHIYKDKLNKTDLLNSLKVLKRYKIINFDVQKYLSTNALEIYPTILYIVTDNDLKMIDNRLMSYKNTQEEENGDEADQDTSD